MSSFGFGGFGMWPAFASWAAGQMGGARMATKLFDTVTLYNTPTTDEAITAVPAQMLMVDLALIAAEVTVTFPGAATIGQCIGILCAGEDGSSGIFGAGPVTSFGFSLSNAGDCALFTWDGVQWQLVSQHHAASAPAFVFLTPTAAAGPVTAANRDYVIQPSPDVVTLPEAPANGTYVAVKNTNGTTCTITAQGGDSIDSGDGNAGPTWPLTRAGQGVLLCYSADNNIWWGVSSYDPPNLVPAELTDEAPTLSPGDVRNLLIYLSSNPVVVTLNAQATTPWLNTTCFEIVAAGGVLSFAPAVGVTIRTPTGKVAEARGEWSRLKLERCATTDDWVISGDLADAGP